MSTAPWRCGDREGGVSDADTVKALVPDSREAVGDCLRRVVVAALSYHAPLGPLDAAVLCDACADFKAAVNWRGGELGLAGSDTVYRITVAVVGPGGVKNAETSASDPARGLGGGRSLGGVPREVNAPDPSRGRAPGYWVSGFLWGAAVAGCVGILW